MNEKTSPLGQNLIRYRLATGLTQEQVARELDVTSMSVSRWERGISVPPFKTREQLAALYGTQEFRFHMPVDETSEETA